MKNKILALTLIGFLGLYLAPTLLASSQGDAHRVYPEFRPTPATDVEIVQKVSLPGKGRPDKPGKPPKPSQPAAATGILGDPVAGHRYAIIIGISDYPGIGSDLNYTDNDALATRNVLVNKYNFNDTNIYLLTDGETAASHSSIVDGSPTYATIADAVADLKYNKGLTSDDEVVFFFSGHGAKGKADDGDKEKIDEAIITHNDSNTNFVYIWDGDLQNWFSNFPTQRIIFIFDSCISGGMTDLADTGRVINMATEETGFNTAVEGIYNGIGAGEFTYYFVIKGIGKGLADTTPIDDQVTVEEAFDYTKANTNYDHPTISDKFENDLLL